MKKIFSFFLQMLLLGAVALSGVSCERIIFEDEGYCPPEEIEPEPGIFRISVRTVPAGAGTASVQGPSDAAGTDGEFYVSILVSENDSYTLTAAENPGYAFFGWHDDTHETFLGKEPVIDLTATASARYTAIFTKIEEEPEPEEPEPDEPGIFRISVKTVPSGAGTASVQGETDATGTEVDLYVSIFVPEDEAYTLTATENDGYEFVGWHDDTNETFLGSSEAPVIDRTATEPAKYTALFIKKAEVPEDPTPEPEPEPGDIRISVRTNIDLAGTAKVASGAKANDTDATQYVSIVIGEDESYTLTATANDGYEFVGWHDDTNDSYLGDEKDKVIGDIRSESSTRYTAIYAKLAEPAEPVRISVRTNIDKAGIARVDAEEGTNRAETVRSYYVSIVLGEDESYTLTAAENDGYVFVGWHDDTNDCYLGGTDGEFEEGKFKVIENLRSEASARYTAVFDKVDAPAEPEPEPEPGEIRISVRTSIDFAGTAKVASGAKANDTDESQYVSIVIRENEAYTLTAVEDNPGYKFVRWHDDTNDENLDGKVIEKKSKASTRYTAVFVKIEEDSPGDPEPDPEPEPEPGEIRISVRTSIDFAGTAKVASGTKANDTDESQYVSIVIKENEAYTLTAVEDNFEYEFVRWHDDTNDENLEGKVIEKKSKTSTRYTAVFAKVDIPADPEPEPEPGDIRISVRTSIDFAGTAKVASGAKANETDATQYVSIVIKENEAYTLTATENPGYEFVRWHDDTNETNLPDGEAVIANIKSPVSTRYTALYKVKVDTPEPEPEPETKYYVEFVYDMNMKFADAFYSQVESVELYVFDTAGKFVKKYEASNKNDNNILKNRNYRMDVSDLAPGGYEFIAWCGLMDNPNFKLPDVIEKNTDAYCTLQYSGGISKDNLNKKPVFHGRIGKVTLEEHPAGSEQTVTVSLTKDTNNINLSLTQLGNAGMASDQFAVRMSGGLLAQMDYENKPTGSSVAYTPWGDYPKYGFVDINGQTADRYNYMRAELSTFRLMANGNPTIEIVDTHNNNKVVFSIPFVDWVNAFRSANHAAMDPQEYLDREDEYNLMLYLENNKEGWIAVSVVINGWRVEDNGEVDL